MRSLAGLQLITFDTEPEALPQHTANALLAEPCACEQAPATADGAALAKPCGGGQLNSLDPLRKSSPMPPLEEALTPQGGPPMSFACPVSLKKVA